jgi:hypothetical protein
MAAQDRWRAVNAPHLVALIRVGAAFVNGKLAGRSEDQQGQSRRPSRPRRKRSIHKYG